MRREEHEGFGEVASDTFKEKEEEASGMILLFAEM